MGIYKDPGLYKRNQRLKRIKQGGESLDMLLGFLSLPFLPLLMIAKLFLGKKR